MHDLTLSRPCKTVYYVKSKINKQIFEKFLHYRGIKARVPLIPFSKQYFFMHGRPAHYSKHAPAALKTGKKEHAPSAHNW